MVAFYRSCLLAAILLIVAPGLYERIIGKIDAAGRGEVARRLLLFRGVDDLKDRPAKVVLPVLIVELLPYALGLHVAGALDLLHLAAGIALVGAALYLKGRR